MAVVESAPTPAASGCASGIALLPCSVVITGAPSSSATSRSSSLASAQSTPWPAQISGVSAASRRSAASRTAPSSAAERMRRTGVYSGAAVHLALHTSPGSSSITGCGRPERSAVKAWRSLIGMWSAASTFCAIFVVAV